LVIQSPLKQVKQYKNVDVKGKWVMLLDISPADMEQGDSYMPTNQRFGSAALVAKLMTAGKNGAAGIIIVSKNFDQANKPATSKVGNMYRERVSKDGRAPIPTISVSYQAAASIISKVITSYTGLKNVTPGLYNTNANISINKLTNNLESSNVMGLLEGTDKKDEYVILTGHYDHLGTRDGIIYYGADDDGSGTVSVLEMAEAFAKAKEKGKGPRRSILFMTVSGEEKGLWGSEYYASHPVYPLNKTTVDLNTDMVGRIDPAYKGDSLNYVYAIGEDKLSSDLMKITDSINITSKLELDRRYNDPKDPNRFYYRSDHYNFAKNGVPIIFYFDGVHKDYHRPTDTVEKINFDLMVKRVRLIFNTAWVMANREDMLKRDMPLNMPAGR
jgi:Zn-dependent M28 family amino/carboxypeptidase